MWDYFLAAWSEYSKKSPLEQLVLLSSIPIIAVAGFVVRQVIFRRPRARSKSRATSAGNARRILIVDDDHETLLAMQLALQQAGFIAEAYDSPEKAVAVFETKMPDLVIVDGAMFPYGGPEVLKRIRKIDPSVPVILVTSFSDRFSEEGSLIKGFDDYVPKPLNLPVLIARVEAKLRRQEDKSRV